MSVNQIELHNVMNNYKEAQQKLAGAKSELDKFVSKNGRENVLSILLKPLFDKYSDLNILGYVGTTPSFNDGEPCKNSSYLYSGLDYDFLEASGNLEDDFEYDEDEETHLNSACFTLSDVNQDASHFESIIEHLYKTNYKVIVKREDEGSIAVFHDYCDPGY